MNWKNVNREPRVKKFAHRFFPGICFVLSLPSKAKERKERQTRKERERETICQETIIAPCYFLFLLIVIKLERVFVLSFDDSLVCLSGEKRGQRGRARAHFA